MVAAEAVAEAVAEVVAEDVVVLEVSFFSRTSSSLSSSSQLSLISSYID
jgi:ribosomal silencing factor RsfS